MSEHSIIIKIKQKTQSKQKILLSVCFWGYCKECCEKPAFTEKKIPDSLKHSDVVPVFKKLDPSGKKNFRPVSLLPLFSKVFEKIMFDKLYEYAETFLSYFVVFVKLTQRSAYFSDFFRNDRKS